MLKLLTIAILSAIITVQSSPLATKTFYQQVTSNKNIRKFVENRETAKYWNECKLKQKDLCILLLNTALEFNKRGLEFTTKSQSPTTDQFCEEFNQVIPRSSEFAETTSYFAKLGNELDGICTSGCIYISPTTYTNETKPVCSFLYENLMVLKNYDIKKDPEVPVVKQDPIKLVENVEKSPPQQPILQKKVAVPDIVQKKMEVPKTPEIEITALKSVIPVAEKKQEEVKEKEPSFLDPKAPLLVEEKQPLGVTPVLVDKKQQMKGPQEVPAVIIPAPTKSIEETIATQTKADIEVEKTPLAVDDGKLDQEEELDDKDQKIFDEAAGKPDLSDPNDINSFDTDDADGDDIGDESDSFLGRDNNKNNLSQKEPSESNNEVARDDIDHHPKIVADNFEEEPESNFFTYLLMVCFFVVGLYVMYHNKQKFLALMLEGRRGPRKGRDRGNRRSDAAYSKLLDSTLEEAITSKKSLNGKTTEIIY
ncbi:unnamed protein product [Diamesa tonsa]